jgi:hypothetical protein
MMELRKLLQEREEHSRKKRNFERRFVGLLGILRMRE